MQAELDLGTSPISVVRSLVDYELSGLERIAEVARERPNGRLRLSAKMMGMSGEEFFEFMNKLETVRVVVCAGESRYASEGAVWGLIRDKFDQFSCLVQAVQSGQVEEPSPQQVEEAPRPVVQRSDVIIRKSVALTVEELQGLERALVGVHEDAERFEAGIRGEIRNLRSARIVNRDQIAEAELGFQKAQRRRMMISFKLTAIRGKLKRLRK